MDRVKIDGICDDINNRYSAPLNNCNEPNGSNVMNNRRSAPEFLEHNP